MDTRAGAQEFARSTVQDEVKNTQSMINTVGLGAGMPVVKMKAPPPRGSRPAMFKVLETELDDCATARSQGIMVTIEPSRLDAPLGGRGSRS